MNKAELRDHFQDEFMGAARLRMTKLDTLSQNAAGIYPLLLSDRTELRVSLPSGMKRSSSMMNRDFLIRNLEKEIDQQRVV